MKLQKTVLTTFLAAHSLLAMGQSVEPGWDFSPPPENIVYPSLGDPGGVPLSFGGGGLPAPMAMAASSSAPVSDEISELAAALENDPQLIYEYVRNNFVCEFYYGFAKGPRQVIQDRSGNDADLANLLVELLLASNHQAYLAWGKMLVPYDDSSGYNMTKWLGYSDPATVSYILDSSGIPNTNQVEHAGYVVVERIFAYLPGYFGGTFFDPAFKPQEYGRNEDILAMSGYDRDFLLGTNVVGGAGNSNEVSQLDESSLRNHLSDLTESLRTTVSSNYPNGYVEHVLGFERTITPEYISGGGSFLKANLVNGDAWYVDSSKHEELRHYIRIHYNATNTISIASESLDGQGLSINLNADGHTGAIWIGESLVYLGEVAVSTNGTYGILIEADHPYVADSGKYADQQWLQQATSNTCYGVVFDVGDHVFPGAVQKSRERLAALDETDGGDVQNRRMVHMIEKSYVHQVALHRAMVARMDESLFTYHHLFGLVANSDDGYSVNMLMRAVPIASSLLNSLAAHVLMGSAMEHGVLEQNQGTNDISVSTVKLLALASREGQRIFKVDSSNYAYVETQLTNYTSSLLSDIQGYINEEGYCIVPEDADIQLNDWTGLGYAVFQDLPGNYLVGMFISGGLNGGEGTIKRGLKINTLEELAEVLRTDVAELRHEKAADPVDMTTGAYLLDSTDMVMDGPLNLALSRHYSSKSASSFGVLGHGWNHSFEMTANRHSNHEAGMGGRSLDDVLPMLLATRVIRDVLLNEDSVKGWMVSALAANWATDQLCHNAVTVSTGHKAYTFIEKPDGSFIPPPGMTVSLTETNGIFTLQERHGNTYGFSTNGLIETIADPDGNTLSFDYTGGTNLNWVQSSFGPKFTFGYTNNLLTSVSDNDGRSVSYQFDPSNNLTNIVDVAGKDWGIGYYPGHLIEWVQDPEGIYTIRNLYNSIGQVVQQYSASENWYTLYFTGTRNIEENPLGQRTVYNIDGYGRTWFKEYADGTYEITDFDGQHQRILHQSRNNTLTAWKYDADHNLLATTNAVGTPEQVVSIFGYDAEHHLRFTTNALGTAEETITEYTSTPTHHVDVIIQAKGSSIERQSDQDYFSNGLLQKRTEGTGKRVTDYTYDSNGNPDTIASTDAGTIDYLYDAQGNMREMEVDGKTTIFNYNARRQPTGILFEDGTSTSRTYWDNGLLKQTTDARGQKTGYFWTPAYKQAGVVLPNAGSTTNLYDDADRLVYARDAVGNWITNTLDKVGRIVEATSSSLSVTNQFDAVGNLTNSVVDPSGLNLWTASTYDDLNRKTSATSALSAVHYHHDSLGRVTNTVDSASKDWKTEYDALGRVKKTFRPSGNYEEVGYDSLGNRTAFWDAEFKPTTFGIDAQGRVTSITNAIDKVIEFSFDDAGNLARRTAADLKVTDYGYNDLNRLVTITNQGVEVATFDHDPNGNIVAHASPLASATLGFDSMNRISASTQTVGSATAIVGYQHDLNGNRTHVIYPGNTNAVYVYGADNRLESVDLSDFGVSTAINFNYDSASRLTNIVYPNGVNSTFGHDAEGRVTSIQHGNFVNRIIQRNSLGFKKTELIDAGIKPTAPDTRRSIKTHNDADQLTSEWVQQGANEHTVSYAYSANGCLTNISPSVQSEESVDYTYDYDNRLSSASSASSAVEYLYDASGARIGRIAGGSPATTNYFVIDYTDGLKRPLAETDSAGTVTRYYVWSGSQLLCQIDADGTTRYYHSDELGSTLALTDESGTVTDEFAYMPYGYATHTAHTGSSDTPFQWLGGYGVYYDSETDLHLTLHRAFSSKMKRFIHPDPLGIDGGVNVYMWANMNPLAFVDPYGLCAEKTFSEKYHDWVDSTLDAWYNPFYWGEVAMNSEMGPLIFATGPLAAAPEGIAAISGAGTQAGAALSQAGAWVQTQWLTLTGAGAAASQQASRLAEGGMQVGWVQNGRVVASSLPNVSHHALGTANNLVQSGQVVKGAEAFTVFVENGQLYVRGSANFGGVLNISAEAVKTVETYFSY